MFNKEEIQAWEEEIDARRFSYWKLDKDYVDPARERLYKRRKNEGFSTGHFYRKESGWQQLRTRREYRKEMNQLVRQGEYEKIRPFQNTSGWETW